MHTRFLDHSQKLTVNWKSRKDEQSKIFLFLFLKVLDQ